MYIKNEVELFTRVGVLKEYNALVGSLTRLGLSIIDLAQAETYGDEIVANLEIDEYTQEYVYGCLGELQAAFKKNTGGDLNLYDDSNMEETARYLWTVDNFYIKVINPEITAICANDLISKESYE
jgi:hypothetical protein